MVGFQIPTVMEQVKNMERFCHQIERCSNKYNNTIVMGDMNLCSDKWKEDNFLYKNISSILIETLDQCGLNERKLGTTFTADGLSKAGSVVTSAIDHIYVSDDLEKKKICGIIAYLNSEYCNCISHLLCLSTFIHC